MLRDGASTTVEAVVDVVWAKSWPRVAPEQWAPLWRHLDDTADIAGLL